MSAQIIKHVTAILEEEPIGCEQELEALAKIKKHDEYTYLHSLNVARLAVNLGRKLNLSHAKLIELGWAALLHDLGKLHVPIEVLNKVSKFSPQELEVMQSHPVESLVAYFKHLAFEIRTFDRLSAAFEHHQRYDLKGYPGVKLKISLHPFSRIIAICDTFDAMTTDRIYQRRILPDLALKIMAQGYGTIFDPVVLQAFITSLGAFPVGSLVRLNDEALAIVDHYHKGSALDRPVVKKLPFPGAKEIDLSSTEFNHLRILRSEFPEDHGIEIRN